ncbi:MAG TPA: hypothetical protein VGD78_23800 [Chthoniobacterales bacterium]
MRLDLPLFYRLFFNREMLRQVIGLLPNQPLDRRIRWDLVMRPNYAYGVYNAALQARALGLKSISAIEFGVATGNGLLALEKTAELVAKNTGVNCQVYGFDTGSGMPPPKDYRDLPYVWREGFFRMDVAALRSRLRHATMVLGDLAETVPNFLAQYRPAPVGFISFDVDYYSSTVSALQLLEGSHDFFLPRVICYFDDMIGSDWEMHSRFAGELLAIDEFNATHHDLKIAKIYGLAQKRRLKALWNEQMFAHHRFGHPLYNEHIFPEKDWQFALEPTKGTRFRPARVRALEPSLNREAGPEGKPG